jgi:hypothetical protein
MTSLLEKFDRQKQVAQAPAIAPATPATTPARRRRQNSRKSSNVGAAVLTGLTLAAVLGAGVVGYEYGAYRPSATGTEQPAGQLDSATPRSSAAASGTPIPEASNSFSIAIASEKPASLNSSEAIVGEKLAPGVELPAVISSDMVRAFVPGVTIDGNPIPQYTDGQFFLPVYNAAHAGKQDNYVGIGPWAPIAIQPIDGVAHLKTEGDPGLFDIVADKPGKVAIYFMQLGKHQHETAVNGNGESNPDWKNQYTIHLTPYQSVAVIDRNGNKIVWDDGKSPMDLDAGPKGDFSIEVPAGDVVFGLVIDVNPNQVDGQATADKAQHGPNDNPGKTGENKFGILGTQAITISAIPEK